MEEVLAPTRILFTNNPSVVGSFIGIAVFFAAVLGAAFLGWFFIYFLPNLNGANRGSI